MRLLLIILLLPLCALGQGVNSVMRFGDYTPSGGSAYPFIVLDGTAYYESIAWRRVFDEEFTGDAASISADGNKGVNYWAVGTGGTLPGNPAPVFEPGVFGTLAIPGTNSNSGREIFGSSLTAVGGLAATNLEFILLARIKTSTTNVAGDLGTLRVGLSSGSAARSEPANCIFIRTSTNANNGIDLVTGRAGVFTASSFAAGIQRNAWTNIAIRLDSTGTNVIGYIGGNASNMVSVLTNRATIPNSAFIAPWFNHWHFAASSGTTGHTNTIDRFTLWVKYP